MYRVKETNKLRNQQGKIVGYRLIDENGNMRDVNPDELKKSIRAGKLEVVNLTLTSDGRLVDAAITKQLKKTGSTKNSDKELYINVGKAMVFIDKNLLDMGDSYGEIVENVCYEAEVSADAVWDCDDDMLDKLLLKAYTKLALNKSEIIEQYMKYRFSEDEINYLESNLVYDKANTTGRDTELYKNLSIIYEYAQKKFTDKALIQDMKKYMDKIAAHDMRCVNFAYHVANRYYDFLDKNIFGTISNDVFTVGHLITDYNIQECPLFAGYEYVFHKDFNILNSPKIAIAMLAKGSSIEFRIASRESYDKPYKYGEVKATVNMYDFTDVIGVAKRVADMCNKMGKIIIENRK